MIWKIEITRTASKQIMHLDKTTRDRILRFLKKLAQHDPRYTGKALKGNKEEFWRYRVGDYRLICTIKDASSQIIVLEIGHRREVYR